HQSADQQIAVHRRPHRREPPGEPDAKAWPAQSDRSGPVCVSAGIAVQGREAISDGRMTPGADNPPPYVYEWRSRWVFGTVRGAAHGATRVSVWRRSNGVLGAGKGAGQDAGGPRVNGPGGVLIVDDDPGICETLSDVLEERGYKVRVFQRAQAALEQLVSVPTDAAILDIMLPDMSGLDVLQAIKTSSPATEVIVITGHASLPTAIRAIDGSAFAYLVKPVEVEHLLAVLRRAIERGQLTRALRESNQTLEAVVEAAPLAIWVANADGTVRMWNPAAERIFGWRRDEVIGRPPPVAALDGGDESRALQEWPLRGEALVAVELQRQRKDGATVDLSVSTAPLRDGSGGIIGVV